MLKRLSILITIIALFGCYGGQDVPNISNKSVNTEAVTDSPSLVKDIESKVSLVETDLTLPEAESLKSTLEGYKDKVKSIDLIKKIDDALEKIEAKIIALKGKEEVAKKIIEIESSYNVYINAKISTPKAKSIEDIEKSLEEITSTIANLEELKAKLENLIASLDNTYSKEKEKLNAMLIEVSSKISEAKKTLETVMNMKIELIGKEEVEKSIAKQIDAVKGQIGEVLSITTIDSATISFFKNLKATISSTNDTGSLDALRVEIIKREQDINKGIADTNSKIAKVSALISSLESLQKEAEKIGSENLNKINNLLASLKSAKEMAIKDSNDLESFKNIAMDAKKEIIEKINTIKEKKFIEELNTEYKKTLDNINPKISEIESNINKIQELIKAKEIIENEINTSAYLDKEYITKLESIKKELDAIDISIYSEILAEFKEAIGVLSVKGGKYIDGIDLQITKIDTLINSLEETVKAQTEAKNVIPDIIEDIQESIIEVQPVKEELVVPITTQKDITDEVLKESYNILLNSKNTNFQEKTKQWIKEIKTVIVKEGKKTISKNTYKTKEIVKVKYYEINGNEITFYRVVRKLVDKYETTKQDGNKTITEKVKKYAFINQPVKKWKIEAITGTNTIVNIYQSVLKKGQWTQYKKIKSFTVTDQAYKKLENLDIIKPLPVNKPITVNPKENIIQEKGKAVK